MPIRSLGSRELRGEWGEIAVNGPKKTPDSKQETGDCQSGCIYQFFSSRVRSAIRMKIGRFLAGAGNGSGKLSSGDRYLQR